MITLAFNNVCRRKIRSTVAVGAVAAGVALPLILTGLTRGTINEVLARIKNVGADIIVSRNPNPALLGARTGVLEESLAENIADVETADGRRAVRPVESVSPVLVWVAEVDGRLQNVYGVRPENFPAFGGPFKDALVAGRAMKGPGEIVVDERFASSAGLKTGDKLKLLGRDLTVVGVVRAGAGARLFFDLDALQKLTGQEGKVSAFYVRCAHPGYVPATARALEKSFPGFAVVTMDALAHETAKSISGLHDFTAAVTALALLTAGTVILLTMYAVVLERAREIGILKALGASRAFILRTIMAETTLLAVIGGCAGLGLAAVLKIGLAVRYPLLNVEMKATAVTGYVLAGILVGVAAGVYPALLATTKDPAETLRFE